jgi:hypothetical protein
MKGRAMRIATLVRIGTVCAVFAAIALVPAAVLAQCAMCKTALDGPPDPLTEAFNVSSLFLMATPYTVVGTVGLWIYRASRRHARHGDSQDTTPELQ